MHKFIVILTIFLFSFQYIRSALPECKKLVCQEITKDNVCILPKDENIFSLQSCKNDNYYCFVDSEYPSEETSCIDKATITYTKYPGMKCTKNSECFSLKCESGYCFGLGQGSECSDAESCSYGLTCRKVDDKNICEVPLSEGQSCSKDTDCEISLGCLNSKCTPYYSLENGENEGHSSQGVLFSFCKSGYSTKNGTCKSLKSSNPTKTCNDENICTYVDEKGQTLSIQENCLCGYNRDGLRYCALGSGESNFTKFIDNIKDYYFHNENCHITERGGLGCLKERLEGDATAKKKIQKLINSQVWALYNYKMYLTEKCSLEIMLPNYDPSADEPEPVPEQPKCAVYTYKDSESFCAKSTYYSKSHIDVTLSDVCQSTEYCNIGGIPNDVFYQNQNVTGTCTNKENEIKYRFPGEQCQKDSDCYQIKPNSIFGKCINKQCSGIGSDESCDETSECVAGYYCDKKEKKCLSQKGKGSECSSVYECQNYLLCYEQKCQDVAYSFKTGETLKIDSSEVVFNKYYCELGSAEDKTCTSLANKNTFTDEYLECQFGSNCEYFSLPSKNAITKTCECGYNSEGKGYCPKAHDKNKDEWIEYYQLKKKLLDNSCHSKNRFNCYDYHQGTKDKINIKKNSLEYGHLFYNAVKNAEKILSDNYISHSFISYILLLFCLTL